MTHLLIRDDLAKRISELAATHHSTLDHILELLLTSAEQNLEEIVVPKSEPGLHDLVEQAMVGTIHSAMDAIVAIDEAERIVVFNQAAAEMFVCSVDEALGQPLGQFLPERYRAAHSAQIRRYGQTSETIRSMRSLNQITGLRTTGEEFPIEATISQATVRGTRFYTAILRDISERVQTEALRLENEKMRVALEKEKELVELKTRFISTVSHEFRTPLAMIVSSAELLDNFSDRMSEERRKQCVVNILAQTNEMVLLMNDVLTFDKATAGKLQLRPGEVSVKVLLQAILDQVQPIYNPTTHHIIVENQGQVDTLWGDEELLKRVFINLLTNAIKYSPQGGEIRVKVFQQGSTILFQVSDQGIGIPSEDQQHLFEPFHRAANTGDISGTGLGLSIVKEFIEAHQGNIAVESEEGSGTTITVVLPLQ
jgi:PAS domain S-box-containing protein